MYSVSVVYLWRTRVKTGGFGVPLLAPSLQNYMKLHEEMEKNMTNALLSIAETAEILKAKKSTVRTWILRGNIPPELVLKIGGSVRIRENKLIKWINGDECI